MSPKANSYHQCCELSKITQQHFSPTPVNLQGCSFPQASFMEILPNVGFSPIWSLQPRERAIYLSGFFISCFITIIIIIFSLII